MSKKTRKQSGRKSEHDDAFHALRRLIDTWQDAGAWDGDPLSRAVSTTLIALHAAVREGDVAALEAPCGPVRWARSYMPEGETLAPRRAEVARRFLSWIDSHRVRDHKNKLPSFATLFKDEEAQEAFVLGAFGWLRLVGARGALVAQRHVADAGKAPDAVRDSMKHRLAKVLKRERCDAKAIAVAMLEAWGVESGDARDALKDKDVPRTKAN